MSYGDATCAWCGEPWEVDYLRHDDDARTPAAPGGNPYRAVLSGAGCPACGYDHGPGEGPHRLDALAAIVAGDVTDDDPALFF